MPLTPLTSHTRTFSVALLDEIPTEMFETKCEKAISQLKGSKERCDNGFKIHDSQNVCANGWFGSQQSCWIFRIFGAIF